MLHKKNKNSQKDLLDCCKQVSLSECTPSSLWLCWAIAGVTRTGTTALVLKHENYKALGALIDQDLARLEKQISHLESCLSSLAEIVSQNHWRLDFLLLQQGGICLGLGEQCPFYTNHSGVINLCPLSVTQKKKKKVTEERKRKTTEGQL